MSPTTSSSLRAVIHPPALRAMFDASGEFALLDVRGQGAFSEQNILQATTLPLGQLELLVPRALPRTAVSVVVMSGARDGLADRAADRLRTYGYHDVSILEGGIEAWKAAGLPVYSGTHVRSKAFSEVLEEELHVPWIDFPELDRLQKAGQPVTVFDSRSFREFQRVTVPGASSLCGAELVRHIHDQVSTQDTLVVVTCGGRTRSIIGAAALINAGLSNRIVSLKDGTMGMRRDNVPMETGATRRPVTPSAASLDWGRVAAERVGQTCAVPTLDDNDLLAWQRDPARTTYLFDVRTPEEYLDGHLPGTVFAQGGQLVQEIDTYAPVWNARIVLVDDAHLIRARMTASWLLQMGCPEVAVHAPGRVALEVGPQPLLSLGLAPLEATVVASLLPDDVLARLRRDEIAVIDLASSPQYKLAHIAGAHFITRARLPERLAQLNLGRNVVLTSDDGRVARLAAIDLAQLGIAASVVAGGTNAWQAAGLPLSAGMERVSDVVDDAWLPPPQRDGDVHAAIVEYLDWELGLPAQVRRDPSVRFRIAKKEA
jgi:rhodanese-related sulfurtransferase